MADGWMDSWWSQEYQVLRSSLNWRAGRKRSKRTDRPVSQERYDFTSYLLPHLNYLQADDLPATKMIRPKNF